MDAHIFATLSRVQAEQDEAKRAELMEQTNAELGQYFSRNTAALDELAWDMYNTVFRDVQDGYWSQPGSEDIIGRLIEVKTVGLNDTDFIEEDLRGLRVYFQGKGGQIRGDVIRAERQQMPRMEMVWALDIHADDIASNFWGSLSDLQKQLAEKVKTAPVQELIYLVQAAIQSGANYGSFAASTLSDTQVDPILDLVLQKSAGNATIVGTGLAIRKFSNIGLDFGMGVQQAIFDQGTIGQYKGVPVVKLANFEDFEGSFVLPDDEIWVIGKNSGRLTYYGNQAKSQVLNLPSFMKRFEGARDVGLSVYGAPKGRMARIVLS